MEAIRRCVRIFSGIAQMEVGCLRHTGASTIGRQLLEGDCSHGWQMSPHTYCRKTGSCRTEWREREGRGGDILEDMLPHKTLTVNAIPVMAANTSQSEHTWNPDTCTYQNTTNYVHCTKGMQALFVVNSVKLHLNPLFLFLLISKEKGRNIMEVTAVVVEVKFQIWCRS